MRNNALHYYQQRKLLRLLTVIVTVLAALGFGASNVRAIFPEYLRNGRTYDQERSYIQWNGSVAYVNLYHKDNTTLPASEGSVYCGNGCTEQVTRIQDGSSISGNFTYLQTFNVQVAYSGDRNVGSAIIRACGQVIRNEDLYIPNQGTPGFNNLPSPAWNVPTAGDCAWSITASGGYVDVRAVTTTYRTTPAPTVDLKVNNTNGPLHLNAPGSYTLSWSSTNAASCTASGSWNGSQSTAGSQAVNTVPAGVYTYNISCSNPAGTATDSVTVNVYRLPTVDVKVNNQNGPLTFTELASYTVTWSSTNASSCQAEGNLPGPINVNGSKIISGVVQGDYVYSVRCTSPTGSQMIDTVQVRVNPSPPTVDLKIDNRDGSITLVSPASFILSWTSQNATTCSATSTDGVWMGSQVANGSKALNNIGVGVRTYSITCTNVSGSATDSVTANILAPLTGTISVLYSKLLLFGPALGTPAQVVNGSVSGGEAPYQVVVVVRSPYGVQTTYYRNGAAWTLDSVISGDPNLGVSEKGTWSAQAEIRDAGGRLFQTNSVTWEVSWYPVHGRP